MGLTVPQAMLASADELTAENSSKLARAGLNFGSFVTTARYPD